MLETRLLKHIHANKCNKAMKMRLRRRDVDMVERYVEMEFSLDGG